VVSRQNADIVDTLQLREVAIASTFWLPVGYNFGCMVALHLLIAGSGFVTAAVGTSEGGPLSGSEVTR